MGANGLSKRAEFESLGQFDMYKSKSINLTHLLDKLAQI